MAHEIEYSGRMKVDLYLSGRNHKEYDVFLTDGMFPNDKDLIDLVDGGDPTSDTHEALHNGGEVIPGNDKKHKIVRIYR